MEKIGEVKLKSFDFFGSVCLVLTNSGALRQIKASDCKASGYFKRMGWLNRNMIGLFCFNNELFFFCNDKYFNVSSDDFSARLVRKGLMFNVFALFKGQDELLKIPFFDLLASSEEGLNSHFLKDCVHFIANKKSKKDFCEIFSDQES
jgi:hypothetical protein